MATLGSASRESSASHVEAESLMLALGDVAISSGSACTSADVEPSHVLLALGHDPERVCHL